MAGSLWSWGKNTKGELGDSTTTNKSSPNQIGTLSSWSAVASNGETNIAIQTDGTLWAWGQNQNGQIGDGTVVDKSSPVQIGTLATWSKVGMAGQNTTFAATSWAIKTDKTLWGWGQNFSTIGTLGDGTEVKKSSPVQIGTLANWLSVVGEEVTGIAVKTDSTLWTWGYNPEGEMGDGTVISRSSPTQIGTLATWASVGGNQFNGFALKTDSTLWAWGYNSASQPLGNGATGNKSSPVQIGTRATWSTVAAGEGESTLMFGIQTDSTLWGWGSNTTGEVGDNTTAIKNSPVQIGTLATWRSVNIGNMFTVATKTDGTLWTWGSNGTGQLGDNTTVNKSSPVQVGTISTWSIIHGGGNGNMVAVQTVAPPVVANTGGFFFFT